MQPEVTTEVETPKAPKKSPQKAEDDSITVEGYTVPKGEEGYFHVELEQPNYDRATGDRLSNPFISKHNPGDFANFIKFDGGGKPQYFALGYRMHKVLHVPGSRYIGGVRVEILKDRKQAFVPIAEALELNKPFLTKPKKV